MAAAPLPLTTSSAGIITITIEPNQGPMVILDRPLIERLEVTFAALPRAGAGLILASGSPRVFIAGADLKSIAAMSVPELEEYLAFGQRVFGMLCQLPYSTIAAINGAALGGGLELAMHCDGLALWLPGAAPGDTSKPFPIGLPEAGLGICPGWGGTNLLPARMDPYEAIERTATGKTMIVDESYTKGIFNVLSERETLLAEAQAWLLANPNLHLQRTDGTPLRRLGRPGLTALDLSRFSALEAAEPAKSCLAAVRAGLTARSDGWAESLKVERTCLNRLRTEPAGAGAIKAFLERSAPKK